MVPSEEMETSSTDSRPRRAPLNLVVEALDFVRSPPASAKPSSPNCFDTSCCFSVDVLKSMTTPLPAKRYSYLPRRISMAPPSGQVEPSVARESHGSVK